MCSRDILTSAPHSSLWNGSPEPLLSSRRLHNFTFGAMPSLGLTGAAITGMKYGVPRLVNGLVRDLFREDAAAYYRDLLAYAVPELETLESAFAWIDRLAAEAIGAAKLIDHLDQAVARQSAPMANLRRKTANDAKRAAARSRSKRSSKRR